MKVHIKARAPGGGGGGVARILPEYQVLLAKLSGAEMLLRAEQSLTHLGQL